MRNILFVAALSLACFSASAQVAADSLASTMKLMSSKLKAISAQVNNPQMNAQSAVLADEFVAATLNSKQFVPDSIASLPAKDQPARRALYDQMLDATAALGKDLATALRANDNAKATAALNQLVQAKKGGHDEFR